MTLKETYEEFILSRKLAGLSEKTLYCYQSFLTPFVDQYGGTLLSALTDQIVLSYVGSVIDRTISKSSKSTYIRHFKVFLRWLEDNYNLGLSVKKIRVPKPSKRVLRVYNDKEVKQIFNSVVPRSGWLAVRNRLIIALMLDSGLRQNEVCTLQKEDVSLRDRLVRVHGKGDKERLVPLGHFTKRYFIDYLSVCPYTSDYLFVSKCGDKLSCDAVKHMMYKMSVSLPFGFSSHKLRHNFATNYCIDMYEENGQIDIYRLMILMGHDDIETTRRYLHHAEQILASKAEISHLDKVYELSG